MLCARARFLRSREPIRRGGKRVLGLALALATFAAPLAAQSTISIDTHLPLFTVLSAVTVAGYRAGVAREEPASVRAGLRNELRQVHGPATEALREFYAAHRLPDLATDLSRYASFALVIGGPPDFAFRTPRIQLPPDVLELEGLNERLRDFYVEANLESLWRKYQPAYETELARLQPSISEMLMVTQAYLRLPPPSYSGRRFLLSFDLLLDPNLTFARNYGDDYYVVLNPAPNAPLDEIRHGYFHFLLDPIAGKYVSAIDKKKEIYPVALRAELLPEEFRHDFTLFTTECLIKAIEIRLNKLPAAKAEEALSAAEQQGFVLARAFHQALAGFEQAEPSIRLYFPELMQGIDVAAELRRLEPLKFATRQPSEAAPRPAMQETMLRDAENAIASGDSATALRLFQAVLEQYGPEQPRALYGLAVLAGLERDWALAKQYFLRTLEKARDPHLVAWSHVYLGRIYDVEGNRELALGEYRAALSAAAAEDVQRAAQRGLEKPFGPERAAEKENESDNEKK